MPARGRPRAHRVGAAMALALTTAALLSPVPSEGAVDDARAEQRQQARPVLAHAADEAVVVRDGSGNELRTTPRGRGGFSLDGDLLAVVRARGSSLHTVGLDLDTGARLFRIKDTLLTPTVLRKGRAVAFHGQGRRDRYATSLWLRNRAGRERQLVQFSFGGSPGVPTGLSEGLVLDYSFSAAADVVAVAAGDDMLTFDYDIWTVDVASGEERRITRGAASRYPAMSPDGEQVAYFREDSMCGGPQPGYRGGDLVVVGSDGRGRKTLHDGDCDRYFTRPRWLTDQLLVAVLHTRREGTDPEPLYDSSVVIIEAGSGMMSRPLSDLDRVGEISVSPSTRRIAFNDWTTPEGFWVYRWTPGSGTPSEQEPWAQGTLTHVEEGRAPHLAGDHTLIPSY